MSRKHSSASCLYCERREPETYDAGAGLLEFNVPEKMGVLLIYRIRHLYTRVLLLTFTNQVPGETCFVVDDSREGWRDALKALLESYFFGRKAPALDMSQLR